jgi:chemotaxis protein methyltransferase CheR
MDAAMMSSVETMDDVELERLLEVIYETYHHDFRAYVRSSLRRRVAQAVACLRLPGVEALRECVVTEPRVFAALLGHLTVQVSDLFRDPSYWRALRSHVVPRLATYPFVRIWVAGCSDGEEAYAMAILLAEEGLLGRAHIYATDISTRSLEVARAGAYPLERVRAFSANYFAAGGRASLADYYETSQAHARFRAELRAHILFSDHSLATDSAFVEVQLVSCRNVLIYFDRSLQDRALGVFVDATCPRGFLGVGSKESLLFSAHADAFEVVSAEDKLYRKRGEV